MANKEGFSHFPNFLEPEEAGWMRLLQNIWCPFLLYQSKQVQALQASVDAGPHDETLSTGRPLAATPGVPLKHCCCTLQFNLSIS